MKRDNIWLKKWGLFLGIIFFGNFLVVGQNFWIPKTPYLDTLYNINAEISQITNSSKSFILPIYVHNKPSCQNLIKSRKGLFILIQGTGQVYRAEEANKDSIHFIRKDSTWFYGNTFGAINFFYKDTLFSLGGYGNWKSNGSLRKFKEGSDWNIVKINVEYPTSSQTHAYFPDKSEVIYPQNIFNEVSEEKPKESLLIALNLKTRKNRILGRVNQAFLMAESPLIINTPSLEGILTVNNGEIYLLQFDKNKVYKLNSQELKQELLGSALNGIARNTFEFNKKLYFTRDSDSKVHTLTLSLNDFVGTNLTLIEPDPFWAYLLIAFLFLIVLGITFYVLFQNRKKLYRKNEIRYFPDLISEPEMLIFTDLEKRIIEDIINYCERGNYVSVEIINRLLGLQKKTLEVQKKVRTEAINRINQKFKVNFEMDIDLIERIRSEQDRRYFIYVIREENRLVYKKDVKQDLITKMRRSSIFKIEEN